MKKTRQSKIIELISNYDIETQDELISRLCEYGYNVTQATISRDIRELKLTKVSSTGGIYKYVLPKEETKKNPGDNIHLYFFLQARGKADVRSYLQMS